MNAPSFRSHRLFHVALTASLLAVAAGVSTLAGHILRNRALIAFVSSAQPTSPNSALCFVFVGISLALSLAPALAALPASRIRRFRLAASLLALAALLLGLLTLIEYTRSWNSGLDDILVRGAGRAAADPFLVRMSIKSAVCFILIAIPLYVNAMPAPRIRSVMASASCSVAVIALAVTSLFTYFSPALKALGWEEVRVMSADSAILFFILGIATLLVAVRRKAFDWELGKISTAGLVTSIALMILIGLTTTRSQQHVTEANQRLAHSEALYARAANTFSNLAHLQNSVLIYLLNGEIESLNDSLVTSDRIRMLVDELTGEYAANPDEARFYPSFEKLSQELLDWSAKTLAARQANRSDILWKVEAAKGNRIMG